MNKLLSTEKVAIFSLLFVIGCGDGPGFVSASVPNDYNTDAAIQDASYISPPIQSFVCPTGWQSCGVPVVLCCAENLYHCGLDGSSYTCISGAYVMPCDANCKSLSDAEIE